MKRMCRVNKKKKKQITVNIASLSTDSTPNASKEINQARHGGATLIQFSSGYITLTILHARLKKARPFLWGMQNDLFKTAADAKQWKQKRLFINLLCLTSIFDTDATFKAVKTEVREQGSSQNSVAADSKVYQCVPVLKRKSWQGIQPNTALTQR